MGDNWIRSGLGDSQVDLEMSELGDNWIMIQVNYETGRLKDRYITRQVD